MWVVVLCALAAVLLASLQQHCPLEGVIADWSVGRARVLMQVSLEQQPPAPSVAGCFLSVVWTVESAAT